jgi:hypothetical protein
MRRVLVLFAFAGTGPACTTAAVSVPASTPSRPRPSSAVVAASQPRRASSPSPGASVRACRATPSTIYGDETVVFDIEASAAPASAEVELFDQQGNSLATARVAVPGQWRPAHLASGDFRLQVGAAGVSCWVTVNRELPRGSQALR